MPAGHLLVKSDAGFFVAQLGLNSAWSFVVFGSRATGGRGYLVGFVMFVPLVIAVVMTLLAFARVSLRAAVLLVPYLAWISFATVLNYQGWRLNS
ncbi:TspO/MBR family protein [Halalkalicoccus jeotgali]|uniref:TspO and MBR-like protein n=1 Tax=Halalkalicoccus jeotgali (strain DSM 18796 / CECT 7217 / JCM 14584 / KCTC 4019 / B3) TaxID=795797 RepID=D8JBC9_HALJB|nr:TspO/MBR family protein [Halalkalicoccus jeotgali]ADJ16582.1 TspO and MBR like protein [Halalkalicoccus jeotgali B3]ELY41322.1 TspO and MBR-like protein [Halalkalicoccus jeotgali B3]